MIYTLTINPAIDVTVATDIIDKEEANKTELQSISVGGKGINASRALNCLGMDNTAIAFCGGFFAGHIGRILEDEAICSSLIEIKGSTRINIKVVEKNTGKLVELNEKGPSITAEEFGVLFNTLDKIGGSAGYFIISGSIPGDTDPAVYRKVTGFLKKKGVKVLLDASGESLYQGMEALPCMVKVNRREMDEISREYLSNGWEEAIREYIERGICLVMITDGAKDTFYYDDSGKYRIISPEIEAPFKTGAGDAVNAGLIFALQNEYILEERLKFAVSCGNANILDEIPGRLDMRKVQELTGRIKVIREE